MHKKREELLSEEELMMVSGGTGVTAESDVSDCPKCHGKRVKRGSKILCTECGYTVLLKTCPNCRCEREAEEFSGGRYKCTACNTIF